MMYIRKIVDKMIKHHNPTVAELLKSKAESNNCCLDYISKSLERRFYKEWVDSINNNDLLSVDKNGNITGEHNFEFYFYLSLNDGNDRNSILDCWAKTKDCIITKHPNIILNGQDWNNDVRILVDYSNCLNDVIDLNDLDDIDINLINFWKNKRNT